MEEIQNEEAQDHGVEEQEVQGNEQPQEQEEENVEVISELGGDEVPEQDPIPEQNRYIEQKRKQRRAMEDSYQQERQDPNYDAAEEYSVDDLRELADYTDNPVHKRWAENMIKQKEEQKIEKLFENKFKQLEQKQVYERTKSEVFNSVVNRNPEIVVRDPAGNFKGFNKNHPLTREMDAYMRNPEIRNHPRALEIAEAFAIRDMHHSKKGLGDRKAQQLKSENAQLKQKTMIEGSGVNTGGGAPNPAVERFNKTGNVKDATAVMGQYFKRKGVLK